jgi:uncharacterized protein (DUF1800 family)
MAELLGDIGSMPQKQLLKLLQDTSTGEIKTLQIHDAVLEELYAKVISSGGTNELSKEDKQVLRKQSAQAIRQLNLLWMNEMINSEAQMREKMSLFWHGHFACRVINILFQQELLDTVRKNALGNFGSLLKAVSKTPAMLSFLNNQQNKKQHPNENFAREVMELFTMGRGNYTENDVKEAARAFTGWGITPLGEFIERPGQHDTGSKTFLGKSGNFNGDDILNILLDRKETAKYITRKIYRYFVNEDVPEDRLNKLADSFYQGNYDIKALLTSIYTSEWFYDSKNIGTRIKSPVELIVGIRRLLPMSLEKEELQLQTQKILGQILFYPPNVAGWPGGKNWIDSSSLMYRLRLPQTLMSLDVITVKPKDDDDQMMGMQAEAAKALAAAGGVKIDWDSVVKHFKEVLPEKILAEVEAVVLQRLLSVNNDVVSRYVTATGKEETIRKSIIQLMSTPEYQLC